MLPTLHLVTQLRSHAGDKRLISRAPTSATALREEVRCGAVRCGVAWRGIVWCGMVCCDRLRHNHPNPCPLQAVGVDAPVQVPLVSKMTKTYLSDVQVRNSSAVGDVLATHTLPTSYSTTPNISAQLLLLLIIVPAYQGVRAGVILGVCCLSQPAMP